MTHTIPFTGSPANPAGPPPSRHPTHLAGVPNYPPTHAVPVALNHSPISTPYAPPHLLGDSSVLGMWSSEASLIRQAQLAEPAQLQPASHSATAAGHLQDSISSMQAGNASTQASMASAASGPAHSLSTQPTADAAAVTGVNKDSQPSATLLRLQSHRQGRYVQAPQHRSSASDAYLTASRLLLMG